MENLSQINAGLDSNINALKSRISDIQSNVQDILDALQKSALIYGDISKVQPFVLACQGRGTRGIDLKAVAEWVSAFAAFRWDEVGAGEVNKAARSEAIAKSTISLKGLAGEPLHTAKAQRAEDAFTIWQADTSRPSWDSFKKTPAAKASSKVFSPAVYLETVLNRLKSNEFDDDLLQALEAIRTKFIERSTQVEAAE